MLKKLKSIKFTTWILFISAIYFSGSILQNILAVKTFGNDIFSVCDAGTLISWLVFACMDIITELFGKKTAIKYFTFSSILNVLFTIICVIAIKIPGNDANMSNVFEIMLGTNWRIVLASVSAFLIGNYINTMIMYVMKVKSKNQNKSISFMLRAIISTIFGQLVDNALFYIIAFAPIGITSTYEMSWINILQNVSFSTLIEIVCETIMVPITTKLVMYLKEIEND